MATLTKHRDKLVECPFDKNHKIAVRNQIKHIIECERKSVAKFSVCIYNASHRMARNEFAKHISCCPDGRQHIRDTYVANHTNITNIQTQPKTDDSIGSQINTNTQTVCKDSDEDDCDNWEDDNCPHYSIRDSKTATDSNASTDQNKKQKVTKNQKKRNRKKAALMATASQQITSIWD